MGKKGKSGATQNDKIFDYIYDSTFWPEYMGDAVPLLGTGGLKEILKGSRSKREARNRLLLAYKKAQEDGGDGFGELMDNAVREYATNYMQPGDAMPEFIWKQERFTDLDPTNTSVEDILAQAGNIASALGYGEDDGSVEQMLTDLYGRNIEIKRYEMPTSRDFVESYGKLSELLKSPIATDMLYRNIGLPFDNDPENLYGYISGITDRANRIKLRKNDPLVVDVTNTFLRPYSYAKNSQGRDTNEADMLADAASHAATLGSGVTRRAAKILPLVSKKAGTLAGAGGAAIGLEALIGAAHDIGDSVLTKHVYTTDENGDPDYTERGNPNWGSALGSAGLNALSSLPLLGLSGRNLGTRLLNFLELDEIPKKIGKRMGPIKKKVVGALDRIFDGDVNKKIAKEKKLQARAEAQVETLSGKFLDLEAQLKAEKAKIRKNPFGVKDLKGELRLNAVGKELNDIIAKGEKKQALANKHLKKAEKLDEERVVPVLLSELKKVRDLSIIRAIQTGLVPTSYGGFRNLLRLMNSDDR